MAKVDNLFGRLSDELDAGNAIIVISISKDGKLTLASNVRSTEFMHKALTLAGKYAALPGEDEILPVSDRAEDVAEAERVRAEERAERDGQLDAARYIHPTPDKLQ